MGNPGREGAGNWVIGAYHHIPRTTNVEAELWDLRDGLSLPSDHDFLNIEIEVDASTVLFFMHFSTN